MHRQTNMFYFFLLLLVMLMLGQVNETLLEVLSHEQEAHMMLAISD